MVPKEWQVDLVGIEACERYRNPVHDFVYSRVYFGEAQRVLPTLGQFDVVLIADIIEHLEEEEARELVRECLRHSPVVVISIPVAFYPQGEILGNPYEVHRNFWGRDDFPLGITGCELYRLFRASSSWLADSRLTRACLL